MLSFINISNFYNVNWAFLNFVLYLVLFIVIQQKTLGEKFPRSVQNVFGIILALSLSLTEFYTQFNIITSLGPIVFILVIGWIMYSFMGMLEMWGLAKPAAFTVSYTLIGY